MDLIFKAADSKLKRLLTGKPRSDRTPEGMENFSNRLQESMANRDFHLEDVIIKRVTW